MIHQVYIDMQYYSYANDLELKCCIGLTCSLVNYGGILYHERYMRSVKTRKIISYQQSLNDEDFTLENILAANGAASDPAEIVEETEEKKAQEKRQKQLIEEIIKRQILKNFKRHDRAALSYAIIGGNNV